MGGRRPDQGSLRADQQASRRPPAPAHRDYLGQVRSQCPELRNRSLSCMAWSEAQCVSVLHVCAGSWLCQGHRTGAPAREGRPTGMRTVPVTAGAALAEQCRGRGVCRAGRRPGRTRQPQAARRSGPRVHATLSARSRHETAARRRATPGQPACVRAFTASCVGRSPRRQASDLGPDNPVGVTAEELVAAAVPVVPELPLPLHLSRDGALLSADHLLARASPA